MVRPNKRKSGVGNMNSSILSGKQKDLISTQEKAKEEEGRRK
jgi:hypothetical protein